jgi:hypothetical protein
METLSKARKWLVPKKSGSTSAYCQPEENATESASAVTIRTSCTILMFSSYSSRHALLLAVHAKREPFACGSETGVWHARACMPVARAPPSTSYSPESFLYLLVYCDLARLKLFFLLTQSRSSLTQSTPVPNFSSPTNQALTSEPSVLQQCPSLSAVALCPLSTDPQRRDAWRMLGACRAGARSTAQRVCLQGGLNMLREYIACLNGSFLPCPVDRVSAICVLLTTSCVNPPIGPPKASLRTL